MRAVAGPVPAKAKGDGLSAALGRARIRGARVFHGTPMKRP